MGLFMIKNYYILLLSCLFMTSIVCMEEEKKIESPKSSSRTQIHLRTPKTNRSSTPLINNVPLLPLPTDEKHHTKDPENKQNEEIKINIQNPEIKKESSKLFPTRPLSYYDPRTSPSTNSPTKNSIEKLIVDTIKNKDYATLNYLLFLDINETDENKNSALVIATKNGNEENATLLLAQERVAPNLKNIDGKNALYFAAIKEHDALFKKILLHPFCDPSILIDSQIETFTDVKMIDGEVVDKKIVKKNVQANIQNFIPKHKEELRLKSFCQISLIGEIKRQVDLQNIKAIPLDSAVTEIKTRMNKIYEEQNKKISDDSDDADDRQLPVTLLPSHMTDEYIKQIFEYLLKTEQSPLEKKKSLSHNSIATNKDSLQFTTSTPQVKKSKAKLKSYDTSDILKKHQLIINAANTNNTVQLKELLNFNCHWTDQEKNSLLMLTIIHNNPKAIELLLTKTEINPNEVNKNGMTAFLMAASKNLHDILRLLMSYPAVDTSIKTKYNISADLLTDSLNKNLKKAIQTRIKLDEAVNTCVLDLIKSKNVLQMIDLDLMDLDSINSMDLDSITLEAKNKVKTIKELLPKSKRPNNANKNFIFNMIISRIKFSKTITSQSSKNLPKESEYIKFRITT